MLLKNVPVKSVIVSRMGGFQDSELQSYELEYILAHIVRMSQSKGEWISKFTLEEFFEDFDPTPIFVESPEDFRYYLQQLLKKGYLKANVEAQTLSVTKKFAKLCKEYSQ